MNTPFHRLIHRSKPGSLRGWLAVAVLSLVLTACASPRFVAQPSPGVDIVAESTMSSISKEGMAISVRHASTPIPLGNKVTTFLVTLINQTDVPLEFVPKDFVLLTEKGRQYFAMSPPAVAEAAAQGTRRAATVGVGYGSYNHSSFNAVYWESSYPSGRGQISSSVLAQSLPIQPLTIQPHSMVEGNVYFAVAPRTLHSVRMRITRLARVPGAQGASVEIPYEFVFAVLK